MKYLSGNPSGITFVQGKSPEWGVWYPVNQLLRNEKQIVENFL